MVVFVTSYFYCHISHVEILGITRVYILWIRIYQLFIHFTGLSITFTIWISRLLLEFWHVLLIHRLYNHCCGNHVMIQISYWHQFEIHEIWNLVLTWAWTPNLLICSPAPYPLGHRGSCTITALKILHIPSNQ